jgi:hypothetical protein
MVGRTVLSTACALAVSLCALNAPLAQSNSPQPIPASAGASEDYWTVLTMAPDGSWGVATDISTNRAIASAIGDCKIMSQADIGCGAYVATIRAGWGLGIRCGHENIVVAQKNLADADRAAINREIELRQLYVPNMPPCVRVLTVDPHGVIVAPKLEYSGRTGDSTGDAVTPGLSIDAKAAGDIPTWKTITLGSYTDVNILREALDSLHCGLEDSPDRNWARPAFTVGATNLLTPPCALGESASEIIGRTAFALGKTKTDVDLVVLSVSELGFEDEGAPVADIYARAKQLGLELCSAEVGPQLRLQYLDQPLGEFLHIAMNPIATYGGDLVDLTVANGGASLLLIGGAADSEIIMHSTVRFVFVRPTRIAQPIVP